MWRSGLEQSPLEPYKERQNSVHEHQVKPSRCVAAALTTGHRPSVVVEDSQSYRLKQPVCTACLSVTMCNMSSVPVHRLCML